MVELTLRHFTESFQSDMQVNVIMKNHNSQEDVRLLYLLHGYEGDFHSWNRGSRIFSYLKSLKISYPLYVIMPSARNTYYTDVFPASYGRSYIMDELPQFISEVFPQCTHTPDYTNIAGLSMGGYGALIHYFTHPRKFNQVASFAGAVDLAHRFVALQYDIETRVTGKDKKNIPNFAGTDMDILHLARKLPEQERQQNKISLYCGTLDFLIDENRAFNEHLQSLGYRYSYEEQEGYEHNWDHWDLCLKQWLTKVFVR